jgi:hypothetical protein
MKRLTKKYSIFVLLISIIYFFTIGCESSNNSNDYEIWWVDSGLDDANVAEWKKSSFEKKLSRAGAMLGASLWKGHLNSYEDFDRLKEKAKILVNLIDFFIKAEVISNKPIDDSMKINEIAALVVLVSNDVDQPNDLGPP